MSANYGNQPSVYLALTGIVVAEGGISNEVKPLAAVKVNRAPLRGDIVDKSAILVNPCIVFWLVEIYSPSSLGRVGSKSRVRNLHFGWT